MFAPFLIVALAVLTLAFLSSLFGGLTHYSSGPAPILFGTGFLSVSAWWRIGFIISLVNIVIWFGLGSLWWKLLGLW